MTLRACGYAALILGVLSGLPVPAATADRPNFSGTWKLNEDLSDDPRDKMAEAMEERRHAMGMPGEPGGMGGSMGGGGMAPGGGMRGGPGRGSPDPEEMERRMEKLSKRLAVMTVTHENEKLIVRYADGYERVMVTDGKKHYRESGIGDLETRTRWKNQRVLVVKAKAEDGREITETWELGPDGGFLHVKVEMKGDGRRPSLDLERVYELAPPE